MPMEVREEVVRTLLNAGAGATINTANYTNITALYAACWMPNGENVKADESLEIVRMLLAAGADPTVIGSENGFTRLPIEIAYNDLHFEIAKLLGGAMDIELEKQKALREAAETGDLEEVRKYLDICMRK